MDITTPLTVGYTSAVDGLRDRYLLHDAGKGTDCLVYLHGHGADGSQLFTREDIKVNLPLIVGLGLSVISPDLRGNGWMCPAAVADLAKILGSCREKYGFRHFVFMGGSMGGTGALIFSVRHPELVSALGVMGGVSKLRRYREALQRRCRLSIHREILDAIAALTGKYGIAPYDEESGTGLLRHIYLRSSKDEQEILLTFVLNGDALPHAEEVIRELTARFPALVGIGININREKTNVICGDEYRTLWGKDTITDTLAGVTLSFSPASFYQVNRDAAELLYKKAKESAGFKGDETLLDLFCGVGSIGLSMADAVREVVGIEIVPDAVKCANENAKRNGIKNAAFFAGDASDVEKLLAGAEKALGKTLVPDAVLLDPPRKGCDPKLLDFLALKAIPKIVYVSCNPETLARDVAYLAGKGYGFSKITPVDLFPRTAHVETVVRLFRQ